MGKTILVADDSDTIRRAVQMTFQATEFSVVAVGSADDALGQLERIMPDVVLADCVMEGADGYTMCARIKDAGFTIPVVLMASVDQPIDQQRAEMARATTSLDKPFDTKTLISVVRQLTGSEAFAEEPMTFADTLARRHHPESAPAAAMPISAASPVMAGPSPDEGRTRFARASEGSARFHRAMDPMSASLRRAASEATEASQRRAASEATEEGSARFHRAVPAGVTSGLRQPPAVPVGSADIIVDEEPDIIEEVAGAPVPVPAGPTLEPPAPPSDGLAAPPPPVDVWSLTEDANGVPTDRRIDQIEIDEEDSSGRARRGVHDATTADLRGAATASDGPAANLAVTQAMASLPPEELRAMVKDAIEKVVWEVVPELAETIIREEIRRLTAEGDEA